MSILSHLHQLFHAQTCQAYIHTLRWKDRPLQCPRCQSQDIRPWGNYHYRSGCKRYRCRDCTRTFNDLTGTVLHQSKQSLSHWILATFLLCLSCSSRRIAWELGVPIRTSYRWCCWLRNAALSYEMERQLDGTVEADDLYHTAGHKGQATGAARRCWTAERVGAARNANPAGATTTKTGQRSSLGSVARGLSWCTRHGTLSLRLCKRQLTSPYKQVVVSIQTLPAATGRSRAMPTPSSTIRRRNMRGVMCMRIGPSASSPCSSPICACFAASAKRICRGIWLLPVPAELSSADGV